MQALKVGNLWLVTGFNQRLEAIHHQLRCATAQNSLFAEQVGFGLFGEGGLDAARAQSADALGIGQGQIPRISRCVLLNGNQNRNATASNIFAAHEVTWALGGNHGDIDVGWGLDVAITNVETMTEEDRVTGFEVGLDRFGIEATLRGVWCEHHDQVGFSSCDSRSDDAHSFGFCLGA